MADPILESSLKIDYCYIFLLLNKKVDKFQLRRLQNRLLKVCYVPATSAGLPRVSFFFSFLFFNTTNEGNKAGGTHR